MANRAAYLRVGLLLIGGAAAVIGLVVFLGGQQVRSGVTFETYFEESVEGLQVGSPVKFRGVTLGQVTQIGLVSAVYKNQEHSNFRPTTFGLVLVRFVIDFSRLGDIPGPEEAIGLGLRVRLASQGITGLTYLEIDFVDPQKFPAMRVPWVPFDQYLPSMPSTISQVQSAAQSLLAMLQGVNLEHLSAQLQTVLDDLHRELADGGDAHIALAASAQLATTLRDSIAAADLPATAKAVQDAAVAVRAAAQGPETKELLAATSRAADRLADAAARLPPLIAALQQTVQRTDASVSDVQADLAPVLRDVRDTAANLRETSEDLRRYPASVLFGGPPPRHEPSQ